MKGCEKWNEWTGGEETEKESLMMELTRLVQMVVKESSWWEKRGFDCSILAAAFLCLPPAFLLLGSSQTLCFSAGMLLMGVAHAVITTKGTHLASHGALSESKTLGKLWAIFFIEICGSFSARAAIQGHIKMHHAHTNVIGLGDSSVWKVPFLPRTIYLFIAPLAVPIITPLVALAHLKEHSLGHMGRTIPLMTLGLYSQYWLLIHVSGFLSPLSALLCMLVCRAMFSVPYVHVNIFQVRNTSIFQTTLSAIVDRGKLEPVSAVLGHEERQTPGATPVRRRATKTDNARSHSHTSGNLKRPGNLKRMVFFRGGWKLENPERTHADTGKTCKLRTERDSNLEPPCCAATALPTPPPCCPCNMNLKC